MGYLILAVFIVSWIGIAVIAKRRKLSNVIAVGGGLLGACLLLATVSAVGFAIKGGLGLGAGLAGDAAKGAAVQIVQKDLSSPDSFSLVSYKEFWSGKAADGKDAHVSRVVFNAANGFGATIRGCRLLAFKLQGDQMSWNPATGIKDCREWPDDEKLDPKLLALIQKYDFGT